MKRTSEAAEDRALLLVRNMGMEREKQLRLKKWELRATDAVTETLEDKVTSTRLHTH